VTVPIFTIRVEAQPELSDGATQRLHELLAAAVRSAVAKLAWELPPGTRWSYHVDRGAATQPHPALDPHPFVATQPAGPACLLFVGPSRVCGMPRVHPVHTTAGGAR
jgi:hypothetical protein